MKTLVHVYKPNTFGFADFLRAIYPLYITATNNGYLYKCVINHPIQELLEVENTHYPETEGMFTTEGDFKRLELLLKTDKSNIVVESNYANWCFPIPKKFIQTYIKPKIEITNSVLDTMTRLRLHSKMFVVLHIRCSDHEFTTSIDKTSEVFKNTIKKIRAFYAIIRSKYTFPILVLSSNHVLSSELESLLPGVVTSGSMPCHTMTSDGASLKQTLVDFYLMEHAHTIYYSNGLGFSGKVSGFSYWASKMFNTNYVNFVR